MTDDMTQAERLELADRLATEYTRLLDFVRVATVLLGLLPLLYGGLTWVYGDRLWAMNLAYNTALSVPWAPQSWGTLFIVVGVGTIIAAQRGHRRCIAIFTLSAALMLAMFMVTFLTEVVANDKPGGLPPTIVYGVVSLLFLARSHLAWVSRRDQALAEAKASGGS